MSLRRCGSGGDSVFEEDLLTGREVGYRQDAGLPALTEDIERWRSVLTFSHGWGLRVFQRGFCLLPNVLANRETVGRRLPCWRAEAADSLQRTQGSWSLLPHRPVVDGHNKVAATTLFKRVATATQ